MSEKIYKIHPSIGFARVGNADAADQYTGPTIPMANASHTVKEYELQFPSRYKKNGKVRPQAAFFTIWEYEKATQKPLREIHLGTKDVTKIEWEVELANYKGAWAKFEGIIGRDSFNKTKQRNTEQSDWVMKPLPRKISGKNIGHLDEFIFRAGTSDNPTGESWVKDQKESHKYLGELITDDKGRLKVIGGKGIAASTNPKSEITDSFNNPDWYDDISDGVVKAKINFNDSSKNEVALEAWVIVGPPDFAPDIRQVVTLYDLLSDLSVRDKTLSKSPILSWYPKLKSLKDDFKKDSKKLKLSDYKPHFHDDIYPILLSAFSVTFLHEQAHDFHSTIDISEGSPMLAALNNSDPLDPNASSFSNARKSVFNKLRIPGENNKKADPSVKKEIKFTLPLQNQADDEKTKEKDKNHIDFFSEGDQVRMPLLLADTNGEGQEPFLTLTHTQYQMMRRWADGDFESSTKSTKIDNPMALDIASMENALGGGFYPGTDFGWTMKYTSNFIEPFRIGYKNVDGYGGGKDKTRLIFPGYFSRQMAVPWQADFTSCQKNPYHYYGFWPSQRPDDVLVNDSMTPWFRKNDGTEGSFKDMAEKWFELGFVRKDASGKYVETERGSMP